MKCSFIRHLRHASLSLTLGLPSLALASLLGASPGLAATQAPSQTTIEDSETVVIGFWEDLIDVVTDVLEGDVNDVGDIVDSAGEVQRIFAEREAKQRAEEERQLQELERIRLQEEREAAARAAAEQRRQYFESLTPEQQQVYIAEQQRLQQQQIDMISRFFLEALASSFSDTSTQSGQQGMSDLEQACYNNPSCGRSPLEQR